MWIQCVDKNFYKDMTLFAEGGHYLLSDADGVWLVTKKLLKREAALLLPGLLKIRDPMLTDKRVFLGDGLCEANIFTVIPIGLLPVPGLGDYSGVTDQYVVGAYGFSVDFEINMPEILKGNFGIGLADFFFGALRAGATGGKVWSKVRKIYPKIGASFVGTLTMTK